MDNNENRIFISPIKATLEFSVAKDETPGAPMLGVIALVKIFFFLQNAPKGKWEDHSMFTLSWLPAAFQACELLVANTREFESSTLYKKGCLGRTDQLKVQFRAAVLSSEWHKMR